MVLTGILIPSAVIQSSPAEFTQISDFHSPLRHLIYSGLTACGTFLVWFGLIYRLAERKTRCVLDALVWVLSGVSIFNYMLFGTNLGLITPQLQYEKTLVFSNQQLIINAEANLFIVTAFLVLWLKKNHIMKAVLSVLLVKALGISFYNSIRVQAQMPSIKKAVESGSTEQVPITLSKDGKNVVVIMMDCAIGSFVPYLFQEKPELLDSYDGFVWYPNTLSFGPATNMGTPGLFGGYEYTPEEMNKRSDELLADKHNEALKVMPVIFCEEGFRVTFCDPSYAG